MTKIRFLDIAIDAMTLSEMQRNSFKIETTIIIKFNNTGAVNVHTNAFIFA